jgi:monofunctional biosynthetic peptidoglycan transglycosylase
VTIDKHLYYHLLPTPLFFQLVLHASSMKSKSKSKRKTPYRTLIKFLIITTLGLLVLSVLLVLPWRWLPPPTSAFMLQERWQSQQPITQHWVPMSEISPASAIAVVASEDQKFPQHYGFDFHQLSQALQETRQRRRGASTITQQLAKNLYLWPGRSLARKGLEVYFTLLIEAAWPKQRILEIYLNVVEFGPGIYGVGAASQRFFNKPASAITAHEAALMAAVLPNPKLLLLARPSDYVLQRGAKIEASVRSLGGPAYLQGMRN